MRVRDNPCAAPNCGRNALITIAGQLVCNLHYQRWRLYQAFEAPPKPTPSRYCVCCQCGVSFDRGYGLQASRARLRQYCSPECQRAGKLHLANERLASRFWQHIPDQTPGVCWEWQGRRNSTGYGEFDYRNRPRLAHRIAFMLTKGIDPGTLHVCHSCDNPPCCNPEHLWIGTAKDNMRDAAAKGRLGSGGTFGEDHPNAKLTADQAIAIYGSDEPPAALATKYGVTKEAIGMIRRGVNWARVTGARDV